jgi:hypothetical protein
MNSTGARPCGLLMIAMELKIGLDMMVLAGAPWPLLRHWQQDHYSTFVISLLQWLFLIIILPLLVLSFNTPLLLLMNYSLLGVLFFFSLYAIL